MITSATLSPINTILNIDILWKIFWENTEMMFSDNSRRPNFFVRTHTERKYDQENSPLTTLRRTSQVCHLWREIILGSSALWGRVIDLNVLMWKRRARWRTEVLERAGEAPLHISGTLRMDSKSSEAFFKRLLNERWSSIRKFSVAVPAIGDDYRLFTPPEMWDPLQRPSPNLEVFRLFFESDSQDEGRPISNLPLFDHTAPALYDFALDETLPSFSLHAPWLKQLRELELSNVWNIDAADFITALSDMPLLEGLYIQELGFEPEEDKHPQFRLTLNSLKRLEILDTFESCLFVLKNTTLPSRCVLFMDVINYIGPGKLPKTYVEDICHELSGYIKNHFVDREDSPKSTFFLSLYPYKLSFDITPRIKSRTERSHMFTFDFQLPSTFVYEAFNKVFDPQTFAHTDTFILEDAGMERPVLEQLAAFWSSLPSVTTLTIGCHTLDALLEIQEKYPDNFPNLQTLDYSKRVNPSIIQQSLTFMLKRTDIGRPVATLKLRMPSETMTIADLNHLDVVQGLKVIWGSDIYHNKYV